MNTSKVVIFLSCLFAATLTAPLVTAAAHGGGFSGGHSFAGRPGMGMPGRFGMGMPGRFGMDTRGGNRHDHFDHHHDHFHHHEDNDVIFIGSFGFPWWWGWGGYPYGYYGYGYPYGSQYGYGYGYGGRSGVAELQRRLARAGYYHGSVDGILGPQTRRAMRAYQRDHGYAG